MIHLLIAAAAFALSCGERDTPAPTAPPAAKAAQNAAQDASCEIDNGAFNIELVYWDAFTPAQRAVIDSAARQWEAVVVGDLPDYDFTAAPFVEYRKYLRRTVRTDDVVDDVRVYVGRRSLSGFAAWAGPFYVRPYDEGRLPVLGQMIFNPPSLAKATSENWLYGLALHELGHVLGIGAFWELDGVELLSCSPGQDAHFTGLSAHLAFLGAGGGIFEGSAVPTESDGSHWRSSVFGDELMGLDWVLPYRLPLSLITVAALGDLGYQVNPLAADPYELPTPAQAAAKAAAAQPFCGVGHY